MPRKKQDDRVLSASLLRQLVNFWTVILYGIIIFDFIKDNHFTEFLGPVCAIYISLLAIYTAEKEFERWHDHNLGRHPGEVYVFGWTILVVVLLILELFNRGSYKIPPEVFTSYVVVLGILAITRKSKNNYLSKKKKK